MEGLMKTKTTISCDSAQAPQELNPELLSLLSLVFVDSAQYSQALRIVKLMIKQWMMQSLKSSSNVLQDRIIATFFQH